jgi:DNA-directed RNA polymerase sigma subunit (sigma70/sigma32)
MPIPRYTEDTPGVTPEHLDLLERKRKSWLKNYEPVKQAKDILVRDTFLEKYPKWHEMKTQIPEQWRAILESYYGIDTERLTTTEIGEEMPLNDKPRTRQAIHQILKKAIARLELLNTKID